MVGEKVNEPTEEEIIEALKELEQEGLIEECEPGKWRITKKGIAYVENCLILGICEDNEGGEGKDG